MSYSPFARIYSKYTVKRDPACLKRPICLTQRFPTSPLSYVEATNSMNESVWLSCHVNMFEYFGGVLLKITCDNLKTGVISHPGNGDILLNEAYLLLAKHYGISIIPAGSSASPLGKYHCRRTCHRPGSYRLPIAALDSRSSLAGFLAYMPYGSSVRLRYLMICVFSFHGAEGPVFLWGN